MPDPKSVTNDENAPKERYEMAEEHHIPFDNWTPPAKPPLVLALNQVVFGEIRPRCEDIEEMLLEEEPDSDVFNRDKKGNELSKLPNPDSKFKHLDEGEPGFDGDENQKVMHRLKLVFDFIVCRTRQLCLDINDAVLIYDKDPTAYENASKAYVEFLQNLNERKPKGKPEKKDLESGKGYGKHYRQLFITPKISIPKDSQTPLITGAIIVLTWNPHSSSSGIPIKH